MKKNILLLTIVFSIISCATKKEILYFQDVDQLNLSETSNTFEPVIEYNDILHISLSSIDELVLLPFMRNNETANNQSINSNPGLSGYLVNSRGSINFPVLGAIEVAGLTRGELEKDLNNRLSEYVKDVVVDVRIMNFKITVLGEVNNPGVHRVDDERVTIPEAIALAGDFTSDGKRETVAIIREVNGKRLVTRIDFTKSDLFSSSFYFLKQNDIVYVEPSTKGVKKSGFIPDLPALLSLMAIMLTTVVILTNI